MTPKWLNRRQTKTKTTIKAEGVKADGFIAATRTDDAEDDVEATIRARRCPR